MFTTATQPTDAPTVLARSRNGAVLLAVIGALGPLCLAISHFISPFGVDEFPVMYAQIAADPGAAQLELLFIVLGGIFGTVGALVIGAAVRDGSPRFGAVAAAVTFVGFSVRIMAAQSAALIAAPGVGLSAEQAGSLFESMDGQLQNLVLSPLTIFGFAGVILLGIAGFIGARRGRFPFWLAILLTGSMVITFTMGSLMLAGLLPFRLLSLAWLLVTAAFAATGWYYVSGFSRRAVARLA